MTLTPGALVAWRHRGTPYTTEVVKVHGKCSIDYRSLTFIFIVHSILDEKPVPGNPAKTQNKVHFLEDSSSSEDENDEEHKRPISEKEIILHNLSLGFSFSILNIKQNNR